MQQKSLFYLKKANKIALNSKDQSTKVGAFILDEEEISPLGFGYNGMPRGLPDDDKEKNERPESIYGMNMQREMPYIIVHSF